MPWEGSRPGVAKVRSRTKKMSCTLCTLVPAGVGWFAECGDTRQGPYLSKGMAFRVAAAEAVVLRRKGHGVRISIQDENGEVSAAYCLCDNFRWPAAALQDGSVRR